MSGALAVRAPARRTREQGRRGARPSRALLAALWLGAAVVSGFTIMRLLDPFDEGLLMAVTDRVLRGEWPYADFAWPYGPGHVLLMALLAKALGPSVLWWRFVRTAADATVALLAYVLVRRVGGPRWALVAWLAAAVTIAEPTSANPFPVALALALGAVVAASAGRGALAGGLAALAAVWRPDFGVMAVAAALAALLVRRQQRGPVLAVAVAAAGTALAYAPFALAAGPGRLWDALVARSLREGSAWRLPFPATYHGPLRAWPPGALAHDAKDVVYVYLPLLALAGVAAGVLALAARRRPAARPRGRAARAARVHPEVARVRGRAARAARVPPEVARVRGRAARAARVPPEVAGLAVLGLGSFAYLLSRTDDLHQQPLVVVAAAVLACAAGAARTGAGRAALAVPLAAIALVGVANRLSAALLGPGLEPVHVPGVPGVRVPPREARALPALVALVQRLVPPRRPIYVAPRRSDLVTFSDPLVYFLVRRADVLRADVSLQAPAAAQRRIVAVLTRRRPLVVRWTDPLSSRPEPNARGRPSGSRVLDAYLARAYRLRARLGAYDVLVPRRTP